MNLGCNTLLPTGRLRDCATQFGRDMQIESLRTISEAGFDAIEFSHIEHLCKEDLLAIHQAARDLGLIPWSAHSWQPIAADVGETEAALEEFDDFLGKSELLGVQVVVVHCAGPKDGLDDEQVHKDRLEANLHCLKPMADRVAKTGASVAIENSGSWADWQFTIQMVKGLGHPNVGLNIDTGHATLGDMDPVKAIRAAGSLLITTHLQDNFRKVDDHLPPGLGTIDWPAVVAALKEVEYQGVYMVEISDCPPNREPDAAADTRTAHDNLERFLRDR